MKKLLPLLILGFVASCEVLEEDISGKAVQIVAPTDKAAVSAGEIDFRWMAVEYAAGYEFTVVVPSFGSAERVVADTVIYADSLARSYGCRMNLTAGSYEWRVTGFNGGYKTRAEVRSLTVTSPPEP